MNNSKPVLIVIGVILVIVVGFFIYLFNSENWNYNLQEKGNPYDLDFFYELIEESNPEIEVDRVSRYYDETLPKIKENNATLLKVGFAFNIDSIEVHHLLKFVERGNKAVYITKFPSQLLLASLLLQKKEFDSLNAILNLPTPKYYSNDYVLVFDSISQLKDSVSQILNSNFRTKNFPTSKNVTIEIEDKKTEVYYLDKYNENKYFRYNYFELPGIFKNKYQSLGIIYNIDSLSVKANNFIKIDYGEGSFYFHATPMAFTNYHLYRKNTKDYIHAFLQEFNPGNVYIDDFYHVLRHKDNYNQNSRNPNLPDSPLAFILSISTLRWGWYLLILGTLIFLIFRSKRNQRMIPVIAPLQNNSLEFSKTVGRLFYKEKNHKRMAQEICLYFFNHLRKRYHINTKTFDDYSKSKFMRLFPQETRKINIIAHLSIKSFKEESEITQEELEELYKATRFFILKK